MNLKLISHVHKRSLFVLTPTWENDVWKSSSRILEILKSQFVCDYLNLNLNVQMKSIEKEHGKANVRCLQGVHLYLRSDFELFRASPNMLTEWKIWGSVSVCLWSWIVCHDHQRGAAYIWKSHCNILPIFLKLCWPQWKSDSAIPKFHL